VEALDLLNRLLQFNPKRRPTAEECLRHPFVELFHKPDEEPLAKRRITVELNDNIK
jgi:mitogen-activated protein kinase 15